MQQDRISPSGPPLDNAIRYVRGTATANVAALSAFTVAGNDGITYVAGDRILLPFQTSKAQNGVYVVGPVVGGVAALSLDSDWGNRPGTKVKGGDQINLGSEGTLWGLSTWKVTNTTDVVVGTTLVDIYPQFVRGIATLVAGTVTLTLPLLSTTRSVITALRAVANTTTLTTGGYAAITPVAGIAGSIILQAQVAAGTINVADISTIYYQVQNF